MESWQSVQSWGLFVLVGGALWWYYTPAAKKVARPAPPAVGKESKPKAKKPASAPKPQATASLNDAANDNVAVDSNKKRRTEIQTMTTPLEQKADKDEIDTSTRQFAQSMTQARQGIQMKSNEKSQQRVKTVKTGTPLLSSGSSQADAEEEWSSVVSLAPRAGAVDDMLEPTASGPSALRITAPERPVKAKAPKPVKKAEVETKKQRQNRKKVEEKRAAREAEDVIQNQMKENQRRTAREARGEPAKNGVSAPAPVSNPWAEKNAARDEQLPVHTTNGGNVQLLDTFETESNSSSNQGVSTAATSTTDAAPSRWADDVTSSEVKSNKKLKKKASQADTNGASTPVLDKNNTASRFGQLRDEADNSASSDLADSAWAA